MIGSIMFIHGGLTRERWEYTNDLYGLDLETLIWRLYPCTGTHVEGRQFHTTTAVRSLCLVVGLVIGTFIIGTTSFIVMT